MTEREVILAALKRVYGEPKPPKDKYDAKGGTFEAMHQQKFADADENLDISVHDGYSGFVSAFAFDAEGNLTRCSAWE